MDMSIQEIMIEVGEKIAILKIAIATIFGKAVVWILIETGGITGAPESMGYILLMNLAIMKNTMELGPFLNLKQETSKITYKAKIFEDL